MNIPRVSVGLPVYNGEEYLGQALDSALEQTYGDFEIVISDNASTDATESICRDYAARDNRIRYVRQTSNRGVITNSNLVFEMARGEFFRWASHDDYTSPGHLQECVSVLESNPDVVLSYTWTTFLDKAGEVIDTESLPVSLGSDSVAERYDTYLRKCMGSCDLPYGLIRSGALRKTRLYATHGNSDHHLMLELILQGRFKAVPEYHFFRRWYPEAGGLLSGDEEAAHYDPLAAPAALDSMSTWRALSYNVAGVKRSRLLSRADKRRIIRLLLRGARWDRRELCDELWKVVASPFQRALGS
jgi:glycosyltransferase involved in cell wall biosynthesis